MWGDTGKTITCISSHENKLAHILAQYVKNVANFVTWIDENPSTIFTGSRYIEFIFFLIKATYFLSKKKKKKDANQFFWCSPDLNPKSLIGLQEILPPKSKILP